MMEMDKVSKRTTRRRKVPGYLKQYQVDPVGPDFTTESCSSHLRPSADGSEHREDGFLGYSCAKDPPHPSQLQYSDIKVVKEEMHICTKYISGGEHASSDVHNDMAPIESEEEVEHGTEDSLDGEALGGQLIRQTNLDAWKANVRKRRRMEGLSYLGRKHNGEVIKEAKTMGKPCQSAVCMKSKKLHCKDIQEVDRDAIFKYFWKKLDWKERKIYITSLVDVVPVQRRRSEAAEHSRRTTSSFCHLLVNGERIRVCQVMFLSTLGIKQWCFLNWVGAKNKAKKIKQEENIDIRNEEVEFLTQFLTDLPKVPSHYCRTSSTKIFLEPLFKSINHLYTKYSHTCEEKCIRALSRIVFNDLFKTLNLSLFYPKKKQCDTCCSYNAGNIDAGTWEEHCKRKNSVRLSMQEDKNNASEKVMVACMNLQGLLLCPKLQDSALYYKSKLGVHHFTLYNMASQDATNYLWHEGEGGLTANELSSCIIHFLGVNNTYAEYILWSDGRDDRNRNLVLSNALLKFATENRKRITQKYLEKGHTQMDSDSVHILIQKRLRDRDIYVPAEYATVIREARPNPRPYSVHYVSHHFFLDYSQLKLCKSIHPVTKPEDQQVLNDVRAIRYNVDGSMEFKLSHSDDWTPFPFPTLKDLNNGTKVPPLYTSSQSIKQLKYRHLQELKDLMPADFHGFYDALKHD